jgi:L-lactate dehydrogenase complex protein LldG
MAHQSAKSIILSNIRKALVNPTPMPYPNLDTKSQVFADTDDLPDVEFAKNFNEINGRFIYCDNHDYFIDNLRKLVELNQWNHLFAWETELQDLLINRHFKHCRIGNELDKADAGITFCEALIARTGSVLVSTGQQSGRTLTVYPPVHIIVAYHGQVLRDMEDGLNFIAQKYQGKIPSLISFASGPSRTADIEKTLVLGAHGPKEVYVFFIENKP